MMHTGRSPDGGLLYPAMPFASYTKVTRADSDAIFAFMQSVPPVKLQNRPHDLKFPYNNRSLIIGWRTLFFTEGEFKPDPTKSDDWNRGAYLVAGPRPLHHVPHRDQRARRQFGIGGLRGWPHSDAELVRAVADVQQGRRASATGASRTFPIYLRTGISNRGAVYGPMADVVYNSLQYMTRRRYARDGGLSEGPRRAVRAGRTAPPRPLPRAACCCSLGKTIYDDNARAAMASRGLGKPPHYPPLAGNQSIQMSSAVNPIRMVLNGGYPPGTAGNPMPHGMPPFAQSLSDDEIAAVVTYIRISWGNHGAAVSAREANELRAAPLQLRTS